VTSEWDTQIGKQLHAMDKLDESEDQLCWTKVFSTEVGMRPAEPCSVSVVATHQLLTNLFEYICVVILSDHRFRRATAAVISEEDLLVLERCNQSNIDALADIIGVSKYGFTPGKNKNRTETELREAGDVWADHVLENARAYIMTFIYIFSTVTSGYPVFYAMAYAAGLDKSNDWIYLSKSVLRAILFTLSLANTTVLTKHFVFGSPRARCSDLFLATSDQYHDFATSSGTKPAPSHGRANGGDRRYPLGCSISGCLSE
jgi:hypothetical protein